MDFKSLWIKWRVNIIGWIGVALGVSRVGWFTPEGCTGDACHVNTWAIIMGILGAILVWFLKDKGVTGGIVPLTKEAESRVTGHKADPSTK